MFDAQERTKAAPRKIWIDLDNSPHVPFFIPIMQELERRGYSMVVTARDCFQVCALADLFHLKYKRIGRHYGKHKFVKGLGLTLRALQLLPTALRERPHLSLSHGSRSQVMASTLLEIPSVVIFDYEYAKILPFFSPTWMMGPDIISTSPIQKHKLLRYPGIKEDVYVPSFQPDPGIMTELGLADGNYVIVTARPPANEAHYRNPESETLFRAAIDSLSLLPEVKIVVLPRNAKQASSIQKLWPQLFSDRKMIIPDHAVDGLNLIWYSDVVISGGGTMNREAAALNVPVYSVFRGAIGAVDRHLAECGRLILLESVEDVKTKLVASRRAKTDEAGAGNKATLNVIVDHIVRLIESPTTITASAPAAVVPNRKSSS
jgi:predicted glycosyltransferase